MAGRFIKVAGLAVLAAALSASLASAKPYVVDEAQVVSTPSAYVNTPALDQGMQGAAVTPNDRAGTQGVGQNSTDFGMGGRYGQNLIEQKAQDIQTAKTFQLPAPPDERPGTASSPTTPLAIPYLSHGIGVSAAQFSGSPASPDDRAGARGAQPATPGNDAYDVGGVLVKAHPVTTPTAVAAPVSTTGNDGFSWTSAGMGAAALAAVALAIGLLVVLGRRSRHEGVAVS